MYKLSWLCLGGALAPPAGGVRQQGIAPMDQRALTSEKAACRPRRASRNAGRRTSTVPSAACRPPLERAPRTVEKSLRVRLVANFRDASGPDTVRSLITYDLN